MVLNYFRGEGPTAQEAREAYEKASMRVASRLEEVASDDRIACRRSIRARSTDDVTEVKVGKGRNKTKRICLQLAAGLTHGELPAVDRACINPARMRRGGGGGAMLDRWRGGGEYCYVLAAPQWRWG